MIYGLLHSLQARLLKVLKHLFPSGWPKDVGPQSGVCRQQQVSETVDGVYLRTWFEREPFQP